ncbi:type VI lipase adapter Tla3 domain-containing protein [Pseudomonas sp. GZD-222]|uniref:type VI lipase adapter Tla3 domain-containing protein n=1 Tax=Pseudomonas sp. GZD-222 TaxID=3404805 RepID=UPI003BB66B86
MRERQQHTRTRPKLKGYFWIALVLTTAWLGFVGFVDYKAQVDNVNIHDIGSVLRWGVASILGVLGVAYGVHWWANAVANEKAELAAYKATVMAQNEEHRATYQRTYALEIRGTGLAVHGWHQSSIWELIQRKNDNFSSIYSRDATDYKASVTTRQIIQSSAVRAAFKYSAGNAVAYWPIPTFAIAPPKLPEQTGAPGNILGGRNAATLGVTLFLWQDAENTTHAQGMIERLFAFFDDNPKPPQALIISRDGDVTRSAYRVPGTPGLQNVHVVPSVFESMTGLLVARADRVERFLRPYATDTRENNQDKTSDLGKLWAFYWNRDNAFEDQYAEAHLKGAKNPIGPGTMSTAYWHSQLPSLWQTLSNRGPGYFEPSPWLPVRWARHQLKEFDASPVLGYLHRPIKVVLHDEQGKRLKPALRAKALQAGWLEALASLPEGEQPVRVFYDSTDNTDGEIALTNALHTLNTDGHGLELGNVDEGYDIGRRLGNTGVSSALVQINLATIASYQDGGVSAVVYAGADGSLSVQMVRPPDQARKAKNQETRGVDPFMFGAPSARP